MINTNIYDVKVCPVECYLEVFPLFVTLHLTERPCSEPPEQRILVRTLPQKSQSPNTLEDVFMNVVREKVIAGGV